MSESIDRVCRRVDESTRIVAVTDAGIATESGIPDVRSPQAVWTQNATAVDGWDMATSEQTAIDLTGLVDF